ncbi:hypothetical protein H7J06_24530 [Mycobacterium hodleri]|uniref:hypothetical protein n=1 Tax=Mycolicibacterium hodleri TaxID=49897 RepID=UPI0021F2F612|nr:hypothetical protein [Mycolicibacterium hodleri]MCV7136143.1 hypothetical protein [Mycolicibacterium hodleri]
MIDDEDALYADAPELDSGEWSAPAPTKPKLKRRLIDGPLRHTFRLVRAGYRDRCAAAALPCAICHQPIDYRLEHGDPGAFELDHIHSVEDHPNIALIEYNSDAGRGPVGPNFQPSHSVCNKRRGVLQSLERGVAADGGGGTAVKIFTRADGIEFEYEFSLDLYGPDGPTEAW